MDLTTKGKELTRYGQILKDENIKSSQGWTRTTIYKYEGGLYKVRMLNGDFIKIEKNLKKIKNNT